jgi:arsenate reductase
MAEAWARTLHPERFEAFSAGTNPGRLDPRATRAMAEVGVDMSSQWSKHFNELPGCSFDCVITICDSAKETCPVLPGSARHLHAGFDDPPRLAVGASTEEEALAPYRRVRDKIRDCITRLRGLLAGPEMNP